MRVIVGDPAPIAGAEVFLDEVSVGLTGADGSLTVAEVTAGSHTIRAHKDGYEDASTVISVPETTSVTLTLIPLKFSISGSIWDADTGAALNAFEAVLVLDGVETPAWRSGNSFQIIDVPRGYHTLVVRYSGYGDWPWEGDVAKDISLDVRLTPILYTVIVHVEGSGPIPGAEVLLDGVSVGLTGADGTLTIAEVTAGPHTIEAHKEGYSPDSATISVPETTSVTLTLTRLVYTVVVTVTGSQIVGASIYLDDIYVGATDATGTLTITEVTAGSHTIRAHKDGYEDDSATISVPETTSVTLTLTPIAPPTYTISVHVEGSGPIAGARVYIDGVYVGETDSAGNVTIVGVTAGTHTIAAFKYEYEPASATISVPETTSVTLTLIPIPPPPPEYSAVTILVREKIWPPPAIEGAKVVLDGMTEYTDAGGYAFFDNVPYGYPSFTISKAGFKTSTGTLIINAPTELAYIYLERA